MSYPKYIVSYVVMNQKAGSNPFNHSFIVVSKQETEDALIKIENTYGFYSQPTKGKNPLINKFWSTLGLEFKLRGSHGILKREQMRDMDGIGLSAKNCNVNQETYDSLITLCEEQLASEKAAITEHKNQNSPIPAPVDITPEDILSKEKQLEKETGNTSRLRPFEFVVGLDIKNGIHTKNSYTCKTYALELLKDLEILSEKECQEIEASSLGHALPCATGKTLTPMFLHSEGPLKPYYSKSAKKKIFHRYWDEEKNNDLYFTLNPEYALLVKEQDVLEELEALKLLEKTLRSPNSYKEIKNLPLLQKEFIKLFHRFAKLDKNTTAEEVNQLLKESKALRTEATTPIQEPVSSNFLLLAWQATLSISLCLSAVALCMALTTLSGGAFAVVAATSTVGLLTSGYGLFYGTACTPETKAPELDLPENNPTTIALP